eukprot:jgi/Pico_ML_1/55621/g1285.t1
MRAAGERLLRLVLDLAKAKVPWMAKEVHGGSGGSPYVRSEVLGHVRGIVLDRPGSRNAVDLAMVNTMADMLREWESNVHVEAVLVRGEGGKAFCAGGDVKKVAEAARKGDPSVGEDFFRGIYSLVYQIANYGKPYMSLLDGVVMGGGGGISMHGPVILRQFQESHKIIQSAQQGKSALVDCLRMECRMMQRFMNQEDFLIGVQSVLVEKSTKPLWTYQSLDQVSDELVDSFFKPMPGDRELCGVAHPMEGEGGRVYPMSKL